MAVRVPWYGHYPENVFNNKADFKDLLPLLRHQVWKFAKDAACDQRVPKGDAHVYARSAH
jgi:hypothetical protein